VTRAARALPRSARLIALAEVSTAVILMHVAFRAFKRFTDLGQLETRHGADFSPGLAMVLVVAAFMLLRRRRPAEYAIALTPVRRSVTAGLTCAAVYTIIATIAITCGLRRDPTWSSPTFAAIVSALNLSVAMATLWVLRRWEPKLGRVPAWVGWAVMIALPLVPIALGAASGRPVPPIALTVLWLVLGAAVGEELFFRGYVQSRLNEAFGKPFSVFGVAFGPGLIIAAALFGLVHMLNPYDYFMGTGRLAWWHGLTSATTVYYGLLRERTGSIAAPIIVHAFIDLASRTPGLLSAGGWP